MFLQKTPPTEINPWEGFLIFNFVFVSGVGTSRDLPLHAAEWCSPILHFPYRILLDLIAKIILLNSMRLYAF